MHSMSYTLTRGETDFDLEIEYEVSEFYPGNTYGPPEDCEPPSGGDVETMSATHDGEKFELAPYEARLVESHIYETHNYSEDNSYYED